jgi:hypothetical protein
MARASLAPDREHGNAEYVLIIKGLAEKVCDSYGRANIKRITTTLRRYLAPPRNSYKYLCTLTTGH